MNNNIPIQHRAQQGRKKQSKSKQTSRYLLAQHKNE